MSFTVENPWGTGTNQEALEFWLGYLATLPVEGKERTIRGRTWIGPDEAEARKMVQFYEARVAAESGPAINYARRCRPL